MLHISYRYHGIKPKPEKKEISLYKTRKCFYIKP